MKKLTISSTLFLAAFAINMPTASSQEAAKQKNVKPAAIVGDAGTRATILTDHLTEILALTPEQKEKVYAINLEKNNQVDIVRIKAGENKDLFSTERKRINDERDQLINAVLTPEQQAKWISNKAAAKQPQKAKTH